MKFSRLVFAEKLHPSLPYSIKVENDYQFKLSNIALDPLCQQAYLYLSVKQDDEASNGEKEILIAELSRGKGITSLNVSLEFEYDLSLVSREGVIHIIGGFKQKVKHPQSTGDSEMEDESESEKGSTKKERKKQLRVERIQNKNKKQEIFVSQMQGEHRVEEAKPEIRKSMRQRSTAPPPAPLNSKKQKASLSYMAAMLKIDANDIMDDDDDSFSADENEEDDDSSSCENQNEEKDGSEGRKKSEVNSADHENTQTCAISPGTLVLAPTHFPTSEVYKPHVHTIIEREQQEQKPCFSMPKRNPFRSFD